MDQNNASETQSTPRRLVRRLLSGFALALTIALSAYLLFSASRAGSVWFASLWFLALLPAVLCALICYIGDPDQTRSSDFYWQVPLILCGVVCVASLFILHEGVICLVMLSPIWFVSGWIGALVMRGQRRTRGQSVQSSFLIIPLMAAMVEAQVPLPHDQVAVTRSILVKAPPEAIWPYTVSSRHISDREGRWTITHNIIGMPRPRDSVVDGVGVGAVRTAYWGDHVNFQERIVTWAPGRKLGWSFDFTNSTIQDYTDKHISPDGAFLKIDSGDYTLRRVSADTTEVTLVTRYIARTHVNPYAELWGEFLMGDVEANVLTIIKGRAERDAGRAG